jgi:hypothetical protein
MSPGQLAVGVVFRMAHFYSSSGDQHLIQQHGRGSSAALILPHSYLSGNYEHREV